MPEIKDRTEKPEGVIPKKLQNYIILGVSAILIAIVLFSGSGKKKRAEKEVSQKQNPKVEKQEDLRKTKELEREIERFKKELEQQQEVIRRQNLLLQQKHSVSVQNKVITQQTTGRTSSYSWIRNDEIEKDLMKREYKSLFASNVALSYRKPADEYKNLNEKSQNSFEFEKPKKAMVGTPYIDEGGEEENNDDAVMQEYLRAIGMPAGQRQEKQKQEKRVERAEYKQPPAGKYKISAGTIIETVLLNRLVGDFTGPVKTIVTTPVYSNNFQHLLIPKGTIVLGEAKKVQVFGQERLAVVFHRLIFPNNKSISLNKFTGLDQIGATGLKDKVNYHYIRIFGASIMLGLISGWANSQVDYGYAYSGSDAYMSGVADSVSRSAVRILDKFLNIMPTITIREGHRVKVFLSDDLYLNEY